MALRDRLTRNLSGLADSPAGLATISKPLANPANLQTIDSDMEKAEISRISRISISNAPELKKQGLNRLETAAKGLPVTIMELSVFFADDLQSFGSGEVTQAGIVKAVRWYAYTHMQRSAYWWEQDKPNNVAVMDEYRRSIR